MNRGQFNARHGVKLLALSQECRNVESIVTGNLIHSFVPYKAVIYEKSVIFLQKLDSEQLVFGGIYFLFTAGDMHAVTGHETVNNLRGFKRDGSSFTHLLPRVHRSRKSFRNGP